MIITRTPFRITLGGGGTDLPAFYEENGGYVVSGAVDKNISVIINERFEPDYRISYSKTEIVSEIDDIEHPIVREVLRFLGADCGLEIVSVADLPSGNGLGSSGAFTVGLLRALHTYQGNLPTPQEIAEEAFHIEAEVLGEPVGKQDQYIAAHGGIIELVIGTRGDVRVSRDVASPNVVSELEENLLFYYTGVRRSASDVLEDQKKKAKQRSGEDLMKRIKEIGQQCGREFRNGNADWFGVSLNDHWMAKRQISNKMSSPEIDKMYKLALDNGATGGKVMGAGGGGFLMLYVPGSKQSVRSAMEGLGLQEVRFRLGVEGSKVLVDLR